MKAYYQILIKGELMRPTDSKPYEFETYQKALDMVDICYGRESLKKDVQIIFKLEVIVQD